MLRNLDLATLRTLIAVADTGGMTRAANRLNLTQSTVSMQMKRLEELLSLPVLERHGRAMRPTLEGEQLLSYARKLIELNDDAIDSLIGTKDAGSLRFGVPYDIVEPHIPGILQRFVSEYPHVAVKLSSEMTVKLREEFEAGQHDVILTTEPEPGVGGIVLLRDTLSWTGAVNGQAWKQRPLPLTFTQNCMFRKPAIEALDQAGIEWRDAVDTGSSFDAGSVACAADLGVRADISGYRANGMETLNFPIGSDLPALPEYCIVMYTREGPDQQMAKCFSQMIQHAFSNAENRPEYLGDAPLPCVVGDI